MVPIAEDSPAADEAAIDGLRDADCQPLNTALQRATIRYRHRVAGPLSLIAGGGLSFGDHHTVTELLANTVTDVQRLSSRERWSALSYEVLASVRVSAHLAMQAGFTADLAEDATYYQPIVRTALVF